MKKSLLFVLFAMAFFGINAQTILFEAPIRTTGGTATDTLDNGSIVTFELSTDDAEQENDEVDSYYDDDLDVGWEGDPTDFNTLTVGLRFQILPSLRVLLSIQPLSKYSRTKEKPHKM